MSEHSEKEKSGFGTASLVLGIIGICTSFIPIINNLSFVLGLMGLLFISSIKKLVKDKQFMHFSNSNNCQLAKNFIKQLK